MTALSLVLAIKLVVSAALVAGPLLLPQARLAAAFRIEGAGSLTLFRLYGVAMLAIMANYASGFWTIADGRFPWGVVAMGVISNGGAVLVMLATGAWRRVRALAALLALIAAALAIAALDTRLALAPLW